MITQCIGITASGNRCKRDAVKDGFCLQHLKQKEKEQPSEQEEKPKHKVTAPWNQTDNPWSQNMLRLKTKRPGFRVRWIHKDPDNIEKYLDQGWKIADKQHYGGISQEILGETGKLDTRVKRRELILVEIPEDLAKQRDAYIDHKTNVRFKTARNMAKTEVSVIERQLGDKALVEDRWESRKGRTI